MMIETRDVAFLLALKRLGLAALSALAVVGVLGAATLGSGGGESEGSDPTRGGATLAQSR